MAGVYWPICSFAGKIVQCNLISVSWHLLINAIRSRAANVLSDPHSRCIPANRCQSSQDSVTPGFLQCIAKNAQLSCIVSRPRLAYSRFTKGLFKTRQLRNLRNPQRMLRLLFNSKPWSCPLTIFCSGFSQIGKQSPRYLPSSSKHASIFAVILFFGVPP